MKKVIFGLLAIILATPSLATIYIIDSGYFGAKAIRGSDTLIMTGGGGHDINASDSSILYIQNTSSPVKVGESGIGYIDLTDWSTLYFSGGCAAVVYFHGYATTAVLTGGQIGTLVSYFTSPADVGSHVTIYCQTGWTYEDGYLSGYWLDGTAFNIKLVTKSGYSDMFSNITIIPEPMTLLLLGLGGLFLRRKRS